MGSPHFVLAVGDSICGIRTAAIAIHTMMLIFFCMSILQYEEVVYVSFTDALLRLLFHLIYIF